MDGEPGTVNGVLVGVGGLAPVPIPKFDETGREIGFWSMSDVPQENRVSLPPPDASSRPGWHPRNGPFGNEVASGNEHLTSVREDHLQALAQPAGFGYARLNNDLRLETAIADHHVSDRITASIGLRPLPAGLALAPLCAIYGVIPIAQALGMRQHSTM